MTRHRRIATAAALVAASVSGLALQPACTVDTAPSGLRRTPPGVGAKVRVDMTHKPLPDIPLPNDVATWPDPSSRTGLRINASLLANTSIERAAREKFDELEGWGTFGWISVSFDLPDDPDGRPALDLANVARRHQGDDYDLRDDTIYVVNLRTGVPVPLDIGEGSFNYTLEDKQRYWRNDPRRSEEALVFETYDEAAVAGTTVYSPEADTDFDGVLDRPNLDDMDACPPPPSDPGSSDQIERDRCIADHLMAWYERETDTLLASPVVPLDEMTTYAVVVTDRMLDRDGQVVRSPFDFIYHPLQERSIAKLQEHLSNPSLAGYYGDIGGTGLNHVAFAWTFTTQPVFDDMKRLRDGLYGQGAFGHLAASYPPEMKLSRAIGLYDASDIAEGADPDAYKTAAACERHRGNVSVLRYDNVEDILANVAGAVGFAGQEIDEMFATLKPIDYVAVGHFKSPYFLEGGPGNPDPGASFRLNYQTGEGPVTPDTVWVQIAVPRPTEHHKPPYPVVLFNHGSAANPVEALLFAGAFARQGMATLAVTAVGHGMELTEGEELLVRTLLKGTCLGPFGDAFMSGRAYDWNGDGRVDSGGDLWTAYVFHTRDVVRQSALDTIQLLRILRTYDGKRMGQDYDGDGVPELAGDFDADGVVDIGGPDNRYSVFGASFGGIVSTIVGATEPEIRAAASNSGGAGLINIATRSVESQVVNAVTLGTLGPLVVSAITADEPDPAKTACAAGELSLRWVVPHVRSYAEVEFACVPADTFPAAGGTVVVRNLVNGEVRCARADAGGLFRTGIAASTGDRVRVELYGRPDNVDSYKTCRVVDASALLRVVDTWESSLVDNGAKAPDGTVLCTAEKGCIRFKGIAHAAGSPLTSVADGFGYQRQTPSFRRFVGIAQTGVNGADPINFAPYYGLKRASESSPALLTVGVVGDMTVPEYSAVSMGRAAGAVPFLRPEAAELFPALADYVTPQALYTALGNKTPNRVLIDHHVIEGVERLGRTPAGETCGANEVPLSEAACHVPCEAKSECRDAQSCVDGVCLRRVNETDCRNALYDADALGEGRELWAQQTSSLPLRLGRVAEPAREAGVDQVWEPRLLGVPLAASNDGAWTARERVNAMVNAYTTPRGEHTFHFTDTCKSFDSATYLINLTGRYFASDGRDVYFLSHPATHHCLEDYSCPEID